VRRHQIDIERADAGKLSTDASRAGLDPNRLKR
jgi:hypothetical protein